MTKDEVSAGKAVVGIEFGSTRIKAVLIDSTCAPVASGAFDWENSLVGGVWTYSLDEIHTGISTAFANLKKDVQDKFGVKLTKIAALGISAMMHGYLAFDKDGKLLVPFRTWRNTITGEASRKLSELFDYPIPERWSIAHLYQAVLNKESHVKDVSFFTTLAGYAHWMLSGEKAKDFNLLIVPGAGFGCPGHCRISYCVPTQRAERSLDAFAKLAAFYK